MLTIGSAQLRSGDLKPALQKFLPETPGIFIYFPREHRSMISLKLLIDHLRQDLKAHN